LGFLAALGSGGGSGGGSNFNFGSGSSGSSDFTPPGDFLDTFSDIAPYLIALVCFLFVLAIGLWLLRLIGEAGMIASVDRIEGGEKLTFRDGFRAGTSHLKSMVGLSLVLYGPFLLVGLIVAGVALALVFGSAGSGSEELLAGGFGLLALCIVPLACLMGIVGLVVSFVYPMAQRSIIIHRMGVMDGIRNGWQLLRNNFVEILILAVIFLVIGFAVGLATLFVAVPLALIFIIPAVIAVIQGGAVFTAVTIILGVVGVIAFILLSAAITSVVRAFQSTSFTLAYHQWAGKKAETAAV
jgi:hypothetical protein